ncbi:sulfatase [Niabella sp.]|uniref:sulfatase family protein n=1 Tax=Niabella sp. TaxID=1962976 RepID=UPI00261D2BC8|nr:sulfatase [Niabella sp.]
MTGYKNRIGYLLAGVIWIFWTGTAFAQKQNKQPNILCLVTEDIGPYIGCYGDPYANTPNLDRLANEGIRYTRMYASIGVCAPARASLITGLFPTFFGANYMRTSNTKPLTEGLVPPYEAVPQAGVKCYTEYLRAAGYYCTNNAKMDYQFKVPITAWDENGKTAHWKNRPDGMPFFAIFNMEITHESQVWKRANEPLVIDPSKIVPPPYHPNDSVTRRDWAVVYSNIHAMDQLVKQYIDEVKDAGLLDNTIIIWYSDNGGPLPRQKRELYESGALVPFMIRFPDGRYARTVNDRMAMFVDIPATILSLTGIKPPAYMQGIPFLGMYNGPERDCVYGARDRLDEIVERQTCVRDKHYRFVHNYLPEKPGYMEILSRLEMPMMQHMKTLYQQHKLEPAVRRWFDYPRAVEEFYDVDKDPHEMHNLIADPGNRSHIDRLRKKLGQLDKELNPYLGLSEAELRDRLWPGGEQPITKQPEFSVLADGTVKINGVTAGSSIAYQVNGRGLHENHWLLYSKPLSLKKGDVLTAIATRIGYRPSTTIKFVKK